MDDPYIESILSLAQRYTELIENEYQFIHHNRVLSNQGDNGGSNQHIFNSELIIHEANEILDKYQTLLMDMIHVQPFIPTNEVKNSLREAMDYCIQRIQDYQKLIQTLPSILSSSRIPPLQPSLLSTDSTSSPLLYLADIVPWFVYSTTPPKLDLRYTDNYSRPKDTEPLRSSRPLPTILSHNNQIISEQEIAQETSENSQPSVLSANEGYRSNDTTNNRIIRPLPSIPLPSIPLPSSAVLPPLPTTSSAVLSPLPTTTTTPSPSSSSSSILFSTDTEKQTRLRGKAIQELIMSERVYLQHLLRLVNLFLRPLIESVTHSSIKYEEGFPYTVLLSDLPPPINPQYSLVPVPSHTTNIPSYSLSSTDHEYIFHHVDTLLPLHCKLLEYCGEIIEHKPKGWASSNSSLLSVSSESSFSSSVVPPSTNDLCIGPIFIQFAPFFKMYTDYCYGSAASLEDLSVWYQTRQQFQSFITQREQDIQCAGQSLASLLIMPIQRIPRYRLLLTEIRRYTPIDHPDYPLLTKAIELIELAATHLDTNVIKYTNQLRILALQRNLVPSLTPSLIIPSRHLLRYGNYDKLNRSLRSQTYTFFLFNDLLLYTRTSEMHNHRSSSRSSSNGGTSKTTGIPSAGSTTTVSVTHRETTKLYLHGILQIMNVEKYPNNHIQIPLDQQRIFLSKYPYALEIQAIPKSIIMLFSTANDHIDWLSDIQRSIERNNQGRRARNTTELHARYSAPLCILDNSEKRKQCTLCQSTFGITRGRYLCITCGNQICRSCSHTLPNIVQEYSGLLHRPPFGPVTGGKNDGEGHAKNTEETENRVKKEDGTSTMYSEHPHHHHHDTYSSNITVSQSSMSTRTSSNSTEEDEEDDEGDRQPQETSSTGLTTSSLSTSRVSWNMFDIPNTYQDTSQRIRIITILRAITVDPTNRLSSYNSQSIRTCDHCIQILKKLPPPSSIPPDAVDRNKVRPQSTPLPRKDTDGILSTAPITVIPPIQNTKSTPSSITTEIDTTRRNTVLSKDFSSPSPSLSVPVTRVTSTNQPSNILSRTTKSSSVKEEYTASLLPLPDQGNTTFTNPSSSYSLPPVGSSFSSPSITTTTTTEIPLSLSPPQNIPSFISTNTMQEAINKLRKQVETSTTTTSSTSSSGSSGSSISSAVGVVPSSSYSSTPLLRMKPSIPSYGQPLPVPIPDRQSRVEKEHMLRIPTVVTAPYASTIPSRILSSISTTPTVPSSSSSLLYPVTSKDSYDRNKDPIIGNDLLTFPSLPSSSVVSGSTVTVNRIAGAAVVPSTITGDERGRGKVSFHPNLPPTLPPPPPPPPSTTTTGIILPSSLVSNNLGYNPSKKIFTDPFADLLPPW